MKRPKKITFPLKRFRRTDLRTDGYFELKSTFASKKKEITKGKSSKYINIKCIDYVAKFH